MAVNMKFSDMIKEFSGETDFSEWIIKAELVAKLQDIPNLCAFIPLFFSGSALLVYQGLDEDTKNDYNLLKRALNSSFSINNSKAYELFMNRKLKKHESVDGFVSDLKRLASIVNRDSENEAWIKCAFLRGLPDKISLHLNTIGNLQSLPLSALITKARDMHAMELDSNSRNETNSRRFQCFHCKEFGHIAKFCKNISGKDQGKLSAPAVSQMNL